MGAIGTALADQWDRAWKMYLDAAAKFPADEWIREADSEHCPGRQAVHLVEATAFYCGQTPDEYVCPYPELEEWQEVAVTTLPLPEVLATWAEEVRATIGGQLRGATDESLLAPGNAFHWTGANRMEHWIYVLRHHHQHLGELQATLRRRGLELGDWW